MGIILNIYFSNIIQIEQDITIYPFHILNFHQVYFYFFLHTSKKGVIPQNKRLSCTVYILHVRINYLESFSNLISLRLWKVRYIARYIIL